MVLSHRPNGARRSLAQLCFAILLTLAATPLLHAYNNTTDQPSADYVYARVQPHKESTDRSRKREPQPTDVNHSGAT